MKFSSFLIEILGNLLNMLRNLLENREHFGDVSVHFLQRFIESFGGKFSLKSLFSEN